MFDQKGFEEEESYRLIFSSKGEQSGKFDLVSAMMVVSLRRERVEVEEEGSVKS